MIYKTVSAGQIIAKIHRDLKPENVDWEIDAPEWIGEALEHIGSSMQTEKVEARLPVSSFRAVLPQDCYRPIAVFASPGVGVSDRETLPLPYDNPTLGFAGERDATSSLSYSYQPGYIAVSFETGYVLLTYERLPVGTDGFPLVPDNQSYREALLWYVIRKLMLGGYRHPDSRIDYGFADRQWQRYCAQARAQAAFPNAGQLEALAERHTRGIIPAPRDPYFGGS